MSNANPYWQLDPFSLNRRELLSNTVSALGAMALIRLLVSEANAQPRRPIIDPAHPYAPRAPHFQPRAKNVVVIFCAGAVSQLETWDYKPALIEWDNKPLPGGPSVTFQDRPAFSAASISLSSARANGKVGKRFAAESCRANR